MNIFVASWFFPPTTSSEGIVTYKLLSNSEHNYDVCCSTSRQWSYHSSMEMTKKENIDVYSVETDDIEEWQEWTINKFEQLFQKRHYECIMTRSTPPESIVVGREIKKKHPEIKWIASLADPVANNPYELKAYIEDNPNLSDRKKIELLTILRSNDLLGIEKLEKRHESGIKLLAKLKKWEQEVLKEADLLISPSATQLRYICNGEWNQKFFALPHSFDETFYPRESCQEKKNRIKLRYIGYSDALRSLKPIVFAVKRMREENFADLEKLDIEFIGNIPGEIRDMIMDYYLYDIIKCLPSVDYYDSLKLMQSSDWLIHVDAFFPQIQSGGSIFFAGKIADYMGANKPILALTGKGSPADEMIRRYGGMCCDSRDIDNVKRVLQQIAAGTVVEINEAFRENFNAVKVASDFDKKANELVKGYYSRKNSNWPAKPENHNEKLLTICVPSYNVSRYLNRCLTSLVDYKLAGYTEILVIDDGSKDNTASIAKEFAARYEGIVYLYEKENGGHGSTINYAIQKAKGKFFRVVDGDDWVDSRELCKLIEKIISDEIDADVISSNYHEVDIETSAIREVTQNEKLEFYRKYSFEELNVQNIYLTLASMMIKTSILRQMGIKLQEHTFYVDVEFILYPVPYINSLLFTPEFVYKYARGNAEQSVALPNMVKRYDHHTRVLKRVLEYEQRVKLTDGQKKYYDAILERLLFTQYALGLVYDEDKVRGYRRTKTFDAYLYKKRRDLYNNISKTMRLVSNARRYKFNYKKAMMAPSVIGYNIYIKVLSSILNMAQKLFNTPLYKMVRSSGLITVITKLKSFIGIVKK